MGTIMLIGGITGLVVCIVMLFLLPGIFEKQKKKVFEEIEREE